MGTVLACTHDLCFEQIKNKSTFFYLKVTIFTFIEIRNILFMHNMWHMRVIIILCYKVIALISVDIVPSWDIEGLELASVRRYTNERQYPSMSV